MEQIMKDKIKYKSKEEIENVAFRVLRKLNNKSLLNNKNVDCFLMGYECAISDIKEQISAQRKDEFIDYLEQMKIFCSECYHNLENDLGYAGYQVNEFEEFCVDLLCDLYEDHEDNIYIVFYPCKESVTDICNFLANYDMIALNKKGQPIQL